MKEPNVIPAPVAAKEKGCTPEAVYLALNRGDLNGVRMGSARLVYRDKKYEAWTVKETGGRTHKSYKKGRGDR